METVDEFDGLDALRSFRAHDAQPPAGLLERLEEDLLQVIEADVAAAPARRAPVATRPAWREWFNFERLARPAMVAGAAASLVVAMATVGNFGDANTVTAGSAGATQASTSVLDGAASTLFGTNADAPPVVGVIDGTEGEARSAISDNSQSVDARREVLTRLTRNPDELRTMFRAAAADMTGDRGDAGDRKAFELAMALVTDQSLAADLRAAVLRSLDGINGIDASSRTRDSLGRDGIVLSHFDAVTGVRDQYVLAPQGATLLERRSFTTAYMNPACEPGTFVDYAIYDDDGHEISPEQLPLLQWPTTVPSCAS